MRWGGGVPDPLEKSAVSHFFPVLACAGCVVRSQVNKALHNREIDLLMEIRGTEATQKRKDSSVGQEATAATVFEEQTEVCQAGHVEKGAAGPRDTYLVTCLSPLVAPPP